MSNSSNKSAQSEFDPRLKEAMEKIRAILEEYDVAGAVSLVGKTHCEFQYHFPSWSLAKFIETGIQIDADPESFASKADLEEAMALTSCILYYLSDLGGQQFLQMKNVMDVIREHPDPHVVPFLKFQPHREIT